MILLGLNQLSAQKAEFGKIWEQDVHGYSPRVQFEDERFLYTTDYYEELIILEKFNKERLRPDSKQEVELPEWDDTEVDLLRYNFIDDRFIVFLKLDNDDLGRVKLLAMELDFETGKYGESYELGEYQYEWSARDIYFDVNFTPNDKGVLVNSIVYNSETENTLQDLTFYDTNFEEVANREYLISGKNIEVSTRSIVDDEGSLYFIRDNDLVMLDPFNDYEEYAEALPMEDLALNGGLKNWAVSFKPNGNLIFTAMYQTTDSKEQPDANLSRQDRSEGDTQIEGIKYFEYDPLNQEFTEQKLSMFDQEFIDVFRLEDDKYDKHDGEINQDFSYARFLFDDDGNLYLLAQPRHTTISRGQNGVVTGKQTKFEEIMAISFNESGEIRWAERVPMLQEHYWSRFLFGFNFNSEATTWFGFPRASLGYFGFDAAIQGDELHIVYNDEPVNRGGKNQDQFLESLTKLKDGQPVLQTINIKNGKRKAKVLPKLAKPKMYMKPSLMYYSEDDQMFYYFLARKKMLQFCSLKV